MEKKIIDIIVDLCEDENLRNNLDFDLIENGLLDSLSFTSLITILEDEFNIEIQPTEVNPNTWRNINSIIELVKGYIAK